MAISIPMVPDASNKGNGEKKCMLWETTQKLKETRDKRFFSDTVLDDPTMLLCSLGFAIKKIEK